MNKIKPYSTRCSNRTRVNGKLIYRYDEWKEKYHPIVVATLLHE